MMLLQLLEPHQEQIDLIAQAWLASGADSFEVWAENEPVAIWSKGQRNGHSDFLHVPLMAGREKLAEFRVFGTPETLLGPRLEADAALISGLLPLERDIQGLTLELVTTRDQLVALYQLSAATRNCIDLPTLLTRLSEEMQRIFLADCIFWSLEIPDEKTVTVSYPDDKECEDDFCELALKMRMKGDATWHIDSHKLGAQFGRRNLQLMDIQVHGADIAVLGILYPGDKELMSPDLKLIHAIAEYAGAQIGNVLRFETGVKLAKFQAEMELAHQVQSSLLPKVPPRIPGLDVWAASYPASRVGGDFYDFSMHFKNAFSFVVGDISGKGIPAALLMAMTRAILRTESGRQEIPTPETVLSRSNADLYGDFTDLNTFATVFVGQYDVERHHLVYANAGHSPIIYCAAGAKAKLLEADGPPLGILPDSLATNQCLVMGPRDLLVVGSDGLNETINSQGERFGYDRLMKVIERLAPLSAKEIGEGIETAVRTFSDAEQQGDDQTLVVLKRVL